MTYVRMVNSCPCCFYSQGCLFNNFNTQIKYTFLGSSTSYKNFVIMGLVNHLLTDFTTNFY